MEERLRREYLQAMGIKVWERRDPHSRTLVESAPEEPQAPGIPHAAQSKSAAAETPPLSPAKPIPHPAVAAQESGNLDQQDDIPPLFLSDEEPPPWDEAPAWSEAPPWHEAESGETVIADLGWDALRERVKNCRACGLRAGCTQTVFGVGNPTADLMVIGEAPGADEDRQGEPFVGRAGQLLNAMLQAIGLQREEVFIANILKCRPPNNRDPKAEEALQCEPYLLRQIALVAPKVILSVGRISAQNLLKTEIPVGKLRGRLHHFGERRIPLVVTYHPAYLLRSPEQKGKAWEDLQQALGLLHNPRS